MNDFSQRIAAAKMIAIDSKERVEFIDSDIEQMEQNGFYEDANRLLHEQIEIFKSNNETLLNVLINYNRF